jgi:hypothetical protein
MAWLCRQIKILASVCLDIVLAHVLVEIFRWAGSEPAYGDYAVIYVLVLVAFVRLEELRGAAKESKA